MDRSRRRIIVLISAAVAGGVQAAGADAARKRVVVIVDWPISDKDRTRQSRWFRQEGWVLGQNLSIEYTNLAENHDPQVIERKAREIVASKPDVILILDWDQVLLLPRLTKEVPIVFANFGPDPIRLGLVQSLNHPGGNVTGTALPFVSKAWSVAKELRPGMKRIAILAPNDVPAVFAAEYREAYRAVASQLHLQTVEVLVSRDAKFAEIERALRAAGVDAVDVGIGEDFSWYRDLIRFLERSNIIGIWGDAADVRAGGLIAVHPDTITGFWEASRIAARILNGAKPADTPVETVEYIHTSINLRTAKAMGIEIPASVRTGANLVFK
jgi:putative ABC transport system substrate-binding protein